MKKSVKTLLGLLIAASFLLSCAACSRKEPDKAPESKNSQEASSAQVSTESKEENLYYNKEGYPICDETITLKVAGRQPSAKNPNETIQFEEYEKRLGIKLDYTSYANDAWSQQVTTMLASNELPDLFAYANFSIDFVNEYAEQGYFLDFSKYLDIMPNVSKLFELYPEYKAFLTAEDGGIYGFSQLNTRVDSAKVSLAFMSEAWLEKVGMEQPKTLDDLYEVLKAFKENDMNGNGDTTDEIPFAYTPSGSWANELPILWSFGLYGTNYSLNYQVNNGKVELCDATDNYKEFLKYMNKLYEEELINQDAFVVTFDEIKAKAAEENCGYIGFSTPVGTTQEDMNWYYQTGFINGDNKEQTVVIPSSVQTNLRICASADTQYPEAIARFVDYLFTTEGAISCGNGYEGISFDFIDLNGTKVVSHENYWSGYESINDYRSQRVCAIGVFDVYAINDGSIYEALGNTKTEDLLNEDMWKECGMNALREQGLRGKKLVEAFPSIPFTSQEAKDMSKLYTDINNYLRTAKSQFISGKVDIDAGWDEYLGELNKMGLEDLLKIEQQAYDRFMANR